MFKKAAQIAVTFSLLVGAYLGYERGFALVADRLTASRGDEMSTPFPEVEAKSQQIANALAAEVFGPKSWPASKDRRLTYYDAGRGAYIYAQQYKFLNDRKTIKVWPFAMISASKDGKNRKSATSDEAVIDLSQPFGLVKTSAEPSKVVHARMTGNVHIVDDKGTAEVADDLHIRLTYVEYDEKTLQITSDSPVDLVDRDMHVTGLGLTLQLRRKVEYAPLSPGVMPVGGGGGGGFSTETILLRSDAFVDIENATSSGVLPGSSKPDPRNKTRVVATSDGPLLIRMPRERAVVEVGPPDPFREPDPTFARFERNVKVVRGISNPDQLNCDTLDLTLRPDRKPIGDEADLTQEATPAGGGALTELKIRKAVAKGHAVWLQSESQGMKARCLELTYEKNGGEGVPDKTYLNGGLAGRLWVEKVDRIAAGEKAGSIAAVRTVQAMDATILDYGPASNGRSTIISRGPGKMEERPARGATVERTAWWEDEMIMDTWRDQLAATAPTKESPATIPGPGLLKRRVNLSGPSKLVDHKGGHTLDAQERIVAYFEAIPRPAPATGDGEAKIKTLDAFKDVHLTTTARVLTARADFHARFVDPEAGPVVAGNSQPAPGPIATGPASLAVASAGVEPLPEAKPEAPPAPIEPAIDGRANVVFATIVQGPAGGKSEVQDAKLRGSVLVHQDPAKDEKRGKDLTGEALDINSRGNGLMNFVVFAEDPQAFEPKTRLAAAEPGKARLAATKAWPSGSSRLARVDLDGRSIEAPRIGLDQSINYLWAEGAGHFYQVADRGLLDDKGLASSRAPSGGKPAPGTREPMLITWNSNMKGYGISQDFQGNTVAKFEFRGESQEVQTPNGSREHRRGVQALMTDSAIYSDTMDVYMDKPIHFDKVNDKKSAADPNVPKEADPEIAILVCRGQDGESRPGQKYAGVDISSRKLFVESGPLKEKQRIQSLHVVYDKRTGKFEAPGPGIVYLYQGERPKPQPARKLASVVPTSANTKDGKVVARQTTPDRFEGPPTLKLTQIKYTEGMRGNFGVARDRVETEPRESEFVGAVQAANAVVLGPNSSIDLDRPPPDNFFLSSDILRVRSYPPPAGVKADAKQYLFAEGNAFGRTENRTIQGDRITYDSEKELAYAYGEDGKEVALVEQKAIGQPFSTTRGKSGRYNKRTREFTILDPQAIQMYDLNSGIRPKPFDPDLGGSPKPFPIMKLPRQPLRREGRQSTERNGFSGH